MSRTIAYGDVGLTQKTIFAIAIATAVLLVAAVAYVSQVSAVAPADYGLKEGDVVSAAGSDDPDVYIVNEMGYKRLFLNPVIFGFYGHLGGFAAVKNVSPATRDAFGTSGLFRNCETNDEKVYGVETTGEDTGILHWVNTSGSQAVADDANFFKKVFCINNNEFNWYAKGTNYTSVSQVPSYSRVPGATPAPTGPFSVSLAPDNPAAKTITKNATGVEFLKVRFSGSGTVDSVTIKRLGAGETNDFSNVYIYDGAKRLTSGKTFSSATGEATFISLKVSVSGAKDLSVVADMDSTNNTAGNVNYVRLVSVSASGAVSGTPLNGNNMTTSGASGGSVTIAKSGSLSNPTVGQKKAQLSEFKITANTEAASVKRLTMINGGTVKPADISNVMLSTGTSEWSGSVTTDSYFVFDLGSGHTIAKGGNAVFKVWADLGGKRDETVDLYFENDADTYAVGDQYNQGMAVDDAALDTAAEADTLTLQGGVLTIAYNGPTATNVATNATDTTLLKFSMTVASNIEIRKTEFTLCQNDEGSGNFDNAHDTTNGWGSDLLDFKVWNETTNQVVIGPSDGTGFTTNDTGSCPDAATGAQKNFTDVLDLLSGQTYNFKVTADFDADNTAEDGIDLDSDDVVRVVLDDYTDDTPDITIMKYAGTNTSVADADIVPGADINGPNITLKGSSLTLGLAATPKSITYIKGSTGVSMAGFTFAAALGSSLKVTDITLTGYAEDAPSDTSYNEGCDDDTGDTAVCVANGVSKVSLYDGDSGALISSTPSANNLNVSNTGTIKFSSLNWNIAAGATKTLLVKADLSQNDASGTAGDGYAFDINTTTDITAVDDSNNTVNAGNADPNGSTSPTVAITVKSAGTIKVDNSAAAPVQGAKYWGQADTTYSVYRFRAGDEGFYIERLNLLGSNIADATANIDKVKVEYKNEAGSTLTAVSSLDNNASVSFGFSGDSRPFVPKDSSMDVVVKADLKPKSLRSGDALTATDGTELAFGINFSGANADEFRAVGKSGAVREGNDTTDDDTNSVTANTHYVYRVFPEFIAESVAAGEPLGTRDVMKFTIKAHGLADSKLLFDEASSATLRFDVIASGQTSANVDFLMFDLSDGTLVASVQDVTALQDSADDANAVNFNDWEKDIEIAGGSQKTFRVEVGFQNFLDKSDYFQLVLKDDDAADLSYVDGAKTGEDNTAGFTAAGVFRLLPMNSPIFTKL